MAQQEVHFTSEGVHRAMDLLGSKDKDFLVQLEQARNLAQEVAISLVDMNEKDKVPSVRGVFKDILLMQHEANIHIEGLQSLKHSYQASASETDFKDLLARKMQRMQTSHVFDPEHSAELQTFDRSTGTVAANDDDDVVDMNADGPMMERCPLTMKSVFELDQPVIDPKGFIYEKEAITVHIRKASRGRPAMCPVSGTNHTIAEKDLKPAGAYLKQMERRRKNNLGSQAQVQRDTVYDADCL